MARPRSEDKRNAILDAAVAEFAVHGAWTTPTSAVSKAAGVAEGTLFTYFASKDLLVNEVYRGLKLQLADAMFSTCSKKAEPRVQMRHLWDQYVQWGVSNPEKFKVMLQLVVSDRITAETRALGHAPFAAMERLAHDCIQRKLIRNHPVEFIGAMFGGLAETTMKFVAQAGKSKTNYCAAGFEIFWQGIVAR
jgi:AcrR family transcriptional regulator